MNKKNTFNLAKINEFDYFKEFTLSTETETDLLIKGFITDNSNRPKRICEFLTDNAVWVPNDKFFEYYILCYNNLSQKDDEAIVNIAMPLIEGISRKKTLVDIFVRLEYVMSDKIQPDYKTKLLKKIAKRIYDRTENEHYRLFADYAYIYSTKKVEELSIAIKELDSFINKFALKEDNRCYFYLLTLALQRIAILNDKTISEQELSEIYNGILSTEKQQDEKTSYYYDSFDNDYEEYGNDDEDDELLNEILESVDDEEEDDIFEYTINDYNDYDCYDYDTDESKYDIFKCIMEFNCTEVINLFRPNHRCFCTPMFLRELYKVIDNTSTTTGYANETHMIFTPKSVFLS